MVALDVINHIYFSHQAVQETISKGTVEYFHGYTIKASKFLVFSVYNFTAILIFFFILHNNVIRN